MKKTLTGIIFTFLIMMGVTMSDAKNSIDANAKNYTQVRASHILVETKTQASGLKNRIEGGEDFAQMA